MPTTTPADGIPTYTPMFLPEERKSLPEIRDIAFATHVSFHNRGRIGASRDHLL
jgi:hypothetical protein